MVLLQQNIVRFLFVVMVLALVSACQNTSKPDMSEKDAIPKLLPKPNNNRPAEPDWVRNAVLYQCNIRQFSREGNFKGVEKALPRLKDLGISVLWLMPIHPIGKEKRKGKLGSPYSVKDYYGINHDYGKPDDFKKLVNAAHALNIRVILDWVPNHTSWDAVWKSKHPEYYTQYKGDFTVPINEHGQPIEDWSDVCDLDYNNPATRKAMTEAMQYWLREFDIDGYRVDMAGLVPNDFWESVRPALDSVKVPFMLAEWQDEPGHFNSCFNANYGWKWKDVTKDIAAGRQTAIALDTLRELLDDLYPENYTQLYFTQNHDENAHNGTEQELYGPAADAFNVLMFTWSGIPMLYNGQEELQQQRLSFFDRSPISWKKMGKTMFYQKLSTLRLENQALWSGEYGGKPEKIRGTSPEKVYAFYRKNGNSRVLVVINMSKEGSSVTLNPPNEATGAFADLFGVSTVQVTSEMSLNLKPWEYLVLSSTF